jgi:hypothetical protein
MQSIGNFTLAMWNAGLIILNPQILNDMIIAQEGCQPDREYFGGIRARNDCWKTTVE